MFLILLLPLVAAQPCEDSLSIDVTDGIKYSDGSILYDGLRYTPDLVYQSNATGYFRTRGCICELRYCFRKCCPLGSVLRMSDKTCTVSRSDAVEYHGVNVSFRNVFRRNVHVDSFGVLIGYPCGRVFIEDDGDWFVQEDGQLYIELPQRIPPWKLLGPDKYCIDTFMYEDPDGSVVTKLDALACFKENQDDRSSYRVSSTCMLISAVFILATVFVYVWLPELRNMHGRVLIAYLLCLFVGFVFMSTMQILLLQDNIGLHSCTWMTFVIYFFLLSAFFWLNVMCFDIWWTFSGKRGMGEKLSTRARFGAYAAYAFGVPTVLTGTLAALEFSSVSHVLMPNIRHQGCFLSGPSKLLYFYGPIATLCVANIVFFVLTALKITQIKQQTSVLKSKESARHDQQRNENDKQRLLLYVKLFVVMGVNWLLEVVSAIYPQADYIWMFTDAYNVLIGVTLFIIFVCKRKIFRLMKKRIKEKFNHNDSSNGDLRQVNGNDRSNWKNCVNQRASVDTIRTFVVDSSDSLKTTKTTQC